MPNATVLTGDALAVLRTLPPNSVDCVVTSPPYYRQRDYGTAEWRGGDPACHHKPTRKGPPRAITAEQVAAAQAGFTYACPLCGALRRDMQLGIEEHPQDYVEGLVGVLEAVRGILKPTGTLWLNLGDTYNGGGRGLSPSARTQLGEKQARGQGLARLEIDGLAHKQLMGIPWRVALALQDRGWWLRADIIWHKPNPLPESVVDRPTSAHEYLFLLAKSERYYYDWQAVAEPLTGYARTTSPAARAAAKYADGTPGSAGRMQGPRWTEGADGTRVRRQRDVWTIPTRAFNAVREGLADTDHYAVMPDALVRPCILAGCPGAGTVLDPFCGAATVGKVALEEGRDFIGIELNPVYAQMAQRRLDQVARRQNPALT